MMTKPSAPSRRSFIALTAAAALPAIALPTMPAALAASSQASVGAVAPAFTLKSDDGKDVSLKDYAGKTVVLEWTNHDCPFVRKHYSSGNMQKLQRDWTSQGVAWLTIISSAPGEQGAVTADESKNLTASRGAVPTKVLFDPTGKVGRAYGARTTPHMYVVTPDGKLAYMGGIDDKPTANAADIAAARSHVHEALTELAGGKKVSVPVSRAYGCAIKYAS